MACATLKRTLEFDPVHSPNSGRPSKRRRCSPMCMSTSTTSRQPAFHRASPFGEISPILTPEQMALTIREEMRRFHRRKQMQRNQNYSSGEESPQESALDSPGSPSTSFSSLSIGTKEKPLFTFKQVGLICERMVKERESQIREEYDRVLNTKLAEQYDAFVKFTYDQIQKRFEAAAAPSYLS